MEKTINKNFAGRRYGIFAIVLCLIMSIAFMLGGCNVGGKNSLTTQEIKDAINQFDEKITALSTPVAGVNNVNNGGSNESISSLGLPYTLYHNQMTIEEDARDNGFIQALGAAYFSPIKDIVNSMSVLFEPYKIYVDSTEDNMYINCIVSLDMDTRTIVAYYSAFDIEDGSYAQNVKFELQLAYGGIIWEKATFTVMEYAFEEYGYTVVQLVNDVENDNKVKSLNIMNASDTELVNLFSYDYNNNKYLSGITDLSATQKQQLLKVYFTDKIAYLDFMNDEFTAP